MDSKKFIDRSTLSFCFALVLVAVSYLYLIASWQKANLSLYYFPLPDWPILSSCKENMLLALSGYKNGYARTLYGYALFAVLSANFIAVGRSSSQFILKDDIHILSRPEKIALYYLLGSLAASLFWLLLGSIGLYCAAAAIFTALAGCGLFFLHCRHPIVKFKFPALSNQPRLEFFLTLALVLILFIVSANAVPQPGVADALEIHLSLPTFYANEGKFLPLPYQIYSYHTQNLEMLVTWCLLLGSTVAAMLLMWGFLVSCSLLLYGWLKRETSKLSALLSLYLLLSAAFITWYAHSVKNDFTAGLFLLAHYWALSEGLRRNEESLLPSGRWFLMSGLLCAGALGHKLTALFGALGTGTCLFLWEWRFSNGPRHKWAMTRAWLFGFSLAVCPWFLRTFLLTGNPTYPYLTGLFSAPLLKPWHIPTPQWTLSPEMHWSYALYFQLLLGKYKQGFTQLLTWGPGFAFIALAPYHLATKNPAKIKLPLAAAFLSWVLMLPQALEPRYHIGPLILLVCLPFALSLNRIENKAPCKWAALILVTLCFHKSFLQTGIWGTSCASLNSLLLGFSPGNKQTQNPVMDDLRMLQLLLNNRAAVTDKVLYAGLIYNHGLKRKTFPQNDLDREMLFDLAQESSDANDLKERLLRLGVRHILVNPVALRSHKNSPRPQLSLEDKHWQKIRELFNDQAKLLMVTPNKNLMWYALGNGGSLDPIIIQPEEIREMPIIAIQLAAQWRARGLLEQAQNLCQEAVKVSMHPENKAVANELLGSIFDDQKKSSLRY